MKQRILINMPFFIIRLINYNYIKGKRNSMCQNYYQFLSVHLTELCSLVDDIRNEKPNNMYQTW